MTAYLRTAKYPITAMVRAAPEHQTTPTQTCRLLHKSYHDYLSVFSEWRAYNNTAAYMALDLASCGPPGVHCILHPESNLRHQLWKHSLILLVLRAYDM
jgi:hypothetical protein